MVSVPGGTARRRGCAGCPGLWFPGTMLGLSSSGAPAPPRVLHLKVKSIAGSQRHADGHQGDGAASPSRRASQADPALGAERTPEQPLRAILCTKQSLTDSPGGLSHRLPQTRQQLLKIRRKTKQNNCVPGAVTAVSEMLASPQLGRGHQAPRISSEGSRNIS